MDELRRASVRHLANIGKAIEGGDEATAHCTAIILVEAVADNLEAPAVMVLDQSGDQSSLRGNVESRREIAEAKPLTRPWRPAGKDGAIGNDVRGGNSVSEGELLLERGRASQQPEGRARRRLRPDPISHFCLVLAKTRPVADF